jgi:hypothetical protein
VSGVLIRASAVGLALVGALLLAALSDLPIPGEDPETAVLRLSWRLRGQEAGECPRPTAGELERLPPHMRNPDACVGPLPSYDLHVWIDEELRVQEVVSARGARGDRPLYVYRDLPVPPGSHRVRVLFERRLEEVGEVLDMGTTLILDGEVLVAPRTVTLVTRSGETGRLEFRRPR